MDGTKDIYSCSNPIPNFTDIINVELSEGVIDEDITFGYYNDEISWNYLSRLYALLKLFPEFLERSETLEDFYNDCAVNNIGKFYKVDSLIHLLNDSVPNSSLLITRRNAAISINNAITTVNGMEDNLKDVNDIFLHSVAERKFVLSSVQVSTLTGIAGQCPYTGGKGVFMARGMLALTSLGTYYDDSDLCDVESKLSNEEESGFLKVFPNPSSGVFAVAWSTMEGSKCLLRIKDINGKTIGTFKLGKITGLTWCNLTSLPAGTYFLD
ncbi:MAG TPA: hypothetical protein PLD02_10440, partial [Saprospiraceae bacterium]|nr:hypothetical protein [Saprospiraceae bacterium]